MSHKQRDERYWQEYEDGVKLRALCRSCNAADGAKNKQTIRGDQRRDDEPESSPEKYLGRVAIERSPREIRPWNEAFDQDRVAEIAADMRESGWRGRPVIVVADGEGSWKALTASHRLAAAVEAGLDEVPTLELELPAGWLIRDGDLFCRSNRAWRTLS